MFYFYLFERPKKLMLYDANYKIYSFMGEPILEDDFCKRVIRGVDKSEVISSTLVKSPFLGTISYRDISEGAATLIILYSSDIYFTKFSKFGESCCKFLYEISKEKDVHLMVDYPMLFPEMDLDDPFEGVCVDTGEVMHKYGDYYTYLWCWLDQLYPKYDDDGNIMTDEPFIAYGGYHWALDPNVTEEPKEQSQTDPSRID